MALIQRQGMALARSAQRDNDEDELETCVSNPRCWVVRTGGPEPEVVRPEGEDGPAPNPLEIPQRARVVIVLVDSRQVGLGQRYVGDVRDIAPKITINCVMEGPRNKDPCATDLFRRVLLESGASQVSIGPWFSWLTDDGVMASRNKDTGVEIVADFNRGVCNVVGPSYKENTEGSDVCYSLSVQPASAS